MMIGVIHHSRVIEMIKSVSGGLECCPAGSIASGEPTSCPLLATLKGKSRDVEEHFMPFGWIR